MTNVCDAMHSSLPVGAQPAHYYITIIISSMLGQYKIRNND